jgi:tRNA (cmo5U34)-methyltransferase
MGPSEEWTTIEHVSHYLERADEFPHRADGEGVLLEHIPQDARRVLDIGTGDGRLLALLQAERPEMTGVGVDFSDLMLARAHERFDGDQRIALVKHDLADPSDRLLDVHTQLRWLREIGFDDVDCYWKWLEMALLIGVKP